MTQTVEGFHFGPEADAATLLQRFAGLDLGSEHGQRTPERFLDMLDELTQCKPWQEEAQNKDHLTDCIKWKTFPSISDEMIVIQDMPFTSLCSHHVVPFMGVAHVAYVPDKEIAGLSKFARVVRHFARQLQVQEQLTADIAAFLETHLAPRGVGVIVRAEHLCMTIRGVQAPGAKTTTSAMRGVFGDHTRTAKVEFLSIIK
jgi:GTP cyclohydrolase I